jgi:hypothetical protein
MKALEVVAGNAVGSILAVAVLLSAGALSAQPAVR